MRALGAATIATLAIGGVLTGCAGEGGGGGGGKPQPSCTTTLPPAISFATNIQPIFTRSCAVSGCHDSTFKIQNLDLSVGQAYGQLVDVPSTEQSKLLRVKPGFPDDSYLVRKLDGGPNISGQQMPLNCPGNPQNGQQCFMDDEIAAIRQWISECAPNN
jgi:hypothetical protein